jgi:GDP-L-fucose synthase
MKRVYVAGHRGLVGSALVRRLTGEPIELITRSRQELDLENPIAVLRFFARERPTHVYLAAAKVGGILANATSPADFIRNNLLVTINVLEAARDAGVEKLMFLGSSCIYPRMATQPITEDALLTGPLEPTTKRTPSQRSLVFTCAGATIGNSGRTSSVSCQPISTGLAITST